MKTKRIARSGLYEGTPPWRGVSNMNEYETLVEETLHYPYMHMAAMKGSAGGANCKNF